MLLFLVQTALATAQPAAITVDGYTMGTTYSVIYFDEPQRRDFKQSIDSLLLLINKSINTYDSTSEISRFNKSKRGICPRLPFLFEILESAKQVHKASDGAFDPTVMPLVNAWGFGPGEALTLSRQQVDSLKEFVGLKAVFRAGKWLRKKDPRIQLDMGGIGQGYGADKIFDFLRSKNIEHMLVELGGEGVAWGKNLQKNKMWTIGILDPNSTRDQQFFKAYVALENRAFTTSGNYFNYTVIDGRKFGHTIDPLTGYPVQHSLLSASVFANNCTIADAWATAFMVMGLKKAREKANTLPAIDVLYTYSSPTGDVETYMTKGIEKQVTLE
jgi:FAD:protein FMN transferase